MNRMLLPLNRIATKTKDLHLDGRRLPSRNPVQLLYLLAMLLVCFPAGGHAMIQAPPATYVSGSITTDTTWTLAGSPYIITGDVYVHASGYMDPAVTLNIEAGVVVKFCHGTGLIIGEDGEAPSFGALSARGTVTSPIVFTSNTSSPQAGDWKGINFTAAADSNKCILEHARIEYGGHTSKACIWVYGCQPVLRYNTISYSSHSGIYISYADPVIECNTLLHNPYGISVGKGGALPQIHNNNFIGSRYYAIYYDGSSLIDARDNWWGDPRGPGYYSQEEAPNDYAGDRFHGSIEYAPWLTASSGCAPAPPENKPPLKPYRPDPVDGAVGVILLQDETPFVKLCWSGGDPDTGDMAVYDVYLGTAPEALTRRTSGTAQNSRTVSGLAFNTVYYWKIVTRDLRGATVEGPLWHFTTQQPPPPAVESLSVDARSDGTHVLLDWSGYDQAAAGHVAVYRIYATTSSFGDVDGLEVNTTVSAGTFTAVVPSLVRGTTYWFAVVAVNHDGGFQGGVSSVSAIPVDVVAPEDSETLTVQSLNNSLVFSWTPSADTDGDLTGYRIFFDADSQGELLPTDQTTYRRENLAPAAGFAFRVTAVDADGNQSSGLTTTGVTLLPNPTGLVADGQDGYAELDWQAVQENQLLRYYRIYVSQDAFTSVADMTPALTTVETSARVAELTNGTTYHVAVTAVNLSGGETKMVSTVAVIPDSDHQGPAITAVSAGGSPLIDGLTLHHATTVTLTAQDPAGVSQVAFALDAALIGTAYNGSPEYACTLDVAAMTYGGHTLVITATDTLGNTTTVEYEIIIALDPPPPPLIIRPAGSILTNTDTISITGLGPKGSQVLLYNNGVLTATRLEVDAQGNFSTNFVLTEGQNRIRAAARNRAGTSSLSPEIVITLDTTIPRSPSGFTAAARVAGLVRLTWQVPEDTQAAGYNLYRSSAGFSSTADAVRVNPQLITATWFEDLPPTDGTWYYRVTTEDAAGNQSDPSSEVETRSDSTAPRAGSIEYLPEGRYDTTNGRMAPGLVHIRLTVTEPLQATPFLSISPENGSPMNVELSRESDQIYTGIWVISETTPSGTAYAVFSARDQVGNRGTEIDVGGTLKIDTDGPAVTRLVLQPRAPLENDLQNPTTVTVILGLDEAVIPGTLPMLSYTLSGAGHQPEAIDHMSEISVQAGDVQTWQADFVLPPDAGLSEAETLSFIYQASDDLDNTGSRILAANQFQVYQGKLPPLDAPRELTGTPLPAGKIRLIWQAVPDAVGYQLYRQSSDESEFTAYLRLGTLSEFVDEPTADGLYRYALTSIRAENGQEAESGRSAPVAVLSDAGLPPAPINLNLELTAQGIRAAWQAAAATEIVTYRLYRSDQAHIDTTRDLTPVVGGISEITAIDNHPSVSEHTYAVTAVDAAGNESAPSGSVYLNVSLLPVSSLSVVQTNTQPPRIHWVHPGGDLSGFDIYLGTEDEGLKLNSSLLTDTQYVDTGYSGDTRTYTLVAVDGNGHASLARTITLPEITADSVLGSKLKRGIMNRLVYVLQNHTSSTVKQVRLRIGVGGREHLSENVDLAAGGAAELSVPVGGYADLEDAEPLTTTIEITPAEGESVQIIRDTVIEVGNALLVLRLLNQEFTRGGRGSLRFTLENTGQEEIELITATNRGKAPSGDITVSLVDNDDNVLATAPFQQALGAGVLTLAGGDAVARIPAGSTFTSAVVDIAVPAGAPDRLTLRLDIAHLYYHLGREDEVRMKGLATTHALSLIDTAYAGEITGISPQTSTGDRDVIISGRSVDRMSGTSQARVPLKLVIALGGFERVVEVITRDDGTFTYAFKPQAEEGGTYTVCAVHPDINNRPMQGQFVIRKLAVTPQTFNLSIPRNYEKTISLTVAAGSVTDVSNLKLVYAADDQPTGILPPGIHISPAAPVVLLPAGKTTALTFSVWADNTASETETLVLKVADDENPDWARVVMHAHFSQAGPVLFFTPDHLEAGVTLEGTVSESVVLENKGLAPLNDVTVELVSQTGSSIPSWAHLNAPADQGSLAVGDRREIGLSFAPGAAAAEGLHAFYLRIGAANTDTTDIEVYVSVTQSGRGGVLFKLSDIYTGTLDDGDNIVQGLSGARIQLENEVVPTVASSLVADDIGEALFQNLPAGRYKYRVTAPDHQEQIGRVWIRPGMTAGEAVFLDYNLVTVQWDVTETTVDDRYDIILTATYETDVPAPVVIAEPASVTLPLMQAGDVYTGEFALINHGLIRANNLIFRLPGDDSFFSYELIDGLPDHLDAKERLTVAYRVICLQSPGQEGTGGGTCYESRCLHIGYEWICANGHCSQSAVYHCFSYNPHECIGGGGTAIPVSYGGSWGYTGTSSSSPPPTIISGPKCFPKPVRRKCDACSAKDTDKDRKQLTLSSVDLAMRQYNRDHEDLFVKVPGGRVTVHRWYYDDTWHWEHQRYNLIFEPAPDGDVGAIHSGGYVYEPAGAGSDVFTHGIYRIVRQDSGYRWSDKRGSWKAFDGQGRLSAYGTRRGTVAKLLYEEERLVGVADRDGRQVVWYVVDDDSRISQVHDGDGRQVYYAYSDDLLTTVTDVRGNQTTYQYDSRSRIVQTTDAADRSSFVTYDDYENVSSVTDTDGKGYFFEYGYNETTKGTNVLIRSSGGRIKQVWFNRKGETERVQVNGRDIKIIVQDGRNLIVTNDSGNVTRKEFDEWENLTRITYPDGSTVSWQYEHTFNRRIVKINETGVITRWEYDADGSLARKIEAAGTEDERVTEYEYDTDGNLLTLRRLADAYTAEAVTTYQYDEVGNPVAITDAEGSTTTMTYDTTGNVLTRIKAGGGQWRYQYDAAGHLTAAIDPLGNTTGFEYDGGGRKIRAVDARGRERTFAYDSHRHLTRSTDTAGNTVFFEYNDDGKLIRQTDAEGKTKRFEYDSEGRLTATIDGSGNTIAMEYENLYAGCGTCSGASTDDKPSRVIFPTFTREYRYDKRGHKAMEKALLSDAESVSTRFEYDPVGNLAAKTDRENKTILYAYDVLNRLTAVTDAAGGQTLYRYDSRDNLTELTDANGQTTRFAYDLNNRLVSEIQPMGQETLYRYDGAGHLAEKIDARGQKTAYGHDDAGRLTNISYFASANDTDPLKTVTFTYDGAGNLTGYNDGATSATYSYDAAYRKISETVDYGAFQLTIGYTYYKNGLKKNFTAPDGVTYNYRYDDSNRLAAVEIPGVGSITHSVYTWNRPAVTLFPGGSTRRQAYDPLMRLTAITASDPAQNPVMQVQYTYDEMDNITAKDTGHGNYAYAYDDLYRLITAENIDQHADEVYTYDAVGNRLTTASTEGNWTYNRNNELENAGDVTYTYNANGSMTDKTAAGIITRFFYNLENRLARVEDHTGTTIATYGYDPFGRRLWKEVAGTRTWFLYSDEGLVGEYTATGTPIRTYGYKPNATWTTAPLFLKIGAAYYFYHNDHLGTPQKLTTANGATVWSATYTAFGKATINPTSTIQNPLRFPGQYHDLETGLHYNWHRYYNPREGRYLRSDPIGLIGGVNLFAYSRNNPLKYSDFSGLWCGSGFTEWIVPDQPGGYDFSDACRQHDHCYAGLNDDNGNDQCFKLQEDCDRDFYEHMREMCARVNNGIYNRHVPERPGDAYRGRSRSECEKTAWLYWQAVSRFGEKIFSNARTNPACNCNP